jgi:transcriptional regulator with AAA-type ATPase domain
VVQVKFSLADYAAELTTIERNLSKVVALNALLVPQRIALQCRGALTSAEEASADATAASSGTLEVLFAKLRLAVKSIPHTAFQAQRKGSDLYVPPPELEDVVQYVCSGGAGGIAPRPVLLHGAPGLGKSALVRALHDRYHAVRTP